MFNYLFVEYSYNLRQLRLITDENTTNTDFLFTLYSTRIDFFTNRTFSVPYRTVIYR